VTRSPSSKVRVDDLPADDLERRLLEGLCDVEQRLGRDHAPEPVQRPVGHREEGVAGVDRLLLTPKPPDGGPVAAEGRVVLDIVVDQREVVEQLDRRAQRAGPLDRAASRRAAEHRQSRPKPLATVLVSDVNRIQRLVEEAKVVARHPLQEGGEAGERGDGGRRWRSKTSPITSSIRLNSRCVIMS
jgi:hypothetical protein